MAANNDNTPKIRETPRTFRLSSGQTRQNGRAMDTPLVQILQETQDRLNPQLKSLQAATKALKQALRLASDEKADALAMQKTLTKLQESSNLLDDQSMYAAVEAFAARTNQALDALAFEFAQDLKESFEERGETVTGRPPRLVVNDLVLHIDIATRKAQWFYGKEPLTRPIALSFGPILKAYGVQRRLILERSVDVPAFLLELHTAWQQLLDKRSQRPPGGRINLIELYSQLVLNRQSARFWNAPSRATFKDYERVLFVRDLILAQASPDLHIDGTAWRMHLHGATKSQAENSMRSLWLPRTAMDGEYYASLSFEGT